MISAENTVCIPCVCEFRQPLSQVLCPDSARCLFCGASQFQTSGPFRSEGHPAQRGSGSLGPLPLYFPRCMPAAGPAGVPPPAHGPRNGARLAGAPPTAALKDTCVSARATRPGAAGIYPGGSIPEGRAASGGGAQNKRTSLRMSFCSGAGNVTRTHDLLITNQLLYRLSYTSISCFRTEG